MMLLKKFENMFYFSIVGNVCDAVFDRIAVAREMKEQRL